MGVLVHIYQGVRCCRKDKQSIQTSILSQYQAGERVWQWSWWVISSQGKPRSQLVWPTAAHLEPTRQGEDLLREREEEYTEETMSQSGIPYCAKCHRFSYISQLQLTCSNTDSGESTFQVNHTIDICTWAHCYLFNNTTCRVSARVCETFCLEIYTEL